MQYFMQTVSPKETICMKCQILLSRKNKKNIFHVVCSNFHPACKTLKYSVALLFLGVTRQTIHIEVRNADYKLKSPTRIFAMALPGKVRHVFFS